MLIPLLNYCFAEKQNSKRDLVEPIGANGFVIMFTLLADNSNLGMNSHYTGWETKLLEAAHKVQSLLQAGHALGS